MLNDIFEYPFLIRIFNNLFIDQDKIKIISLNKFLNSKRTKFTYNNLLKIREEFQTLWFYDCLTNVGVDNVFKFPNSITHLTFGFFFDKPIENKIPNTVTHLTFGKYFDQCIENNIPNSVTHLTFGMYFSQSIKNGIPNSVIYLKFCYFNLYKRDFNDYLPDSIIDLFWRSRYKIKITKFPSSLKRLHCSRDFFNKNKKIISRKVKIINYYW